MWAETAVFDNALGELKAGRKHSHWMWFIFPQLRGLGSSPMAQFFQKRPPISHTRCWGRDSLPAQKFPRRHEFHSSMTLFAVTADDKESAFRRAIDACCAGRMNA